MKYFLFIFVVALTACSGEKKELPNFSKKEMLLMGKKADPDLRVIVAKNLTKATIDCGEYKPRCRTAFLLRVKLIEMRALYYENQKDAIECAKRRRAYISRNWVFDEVRGEPILERFVVDHLKARKAF